jgi:hypothetical protein
MFIAFKYHPRPAPFGGAELKETVTRRESIRSSDRRMVLGNALVYKHLTPNGVNRP